MSDSERESSDDDVGPMPLASGTSSLNAARDAAPHIGSSKKKRRKMFDEAKQSALLGSLPNYGMGLSDFLVTASSDGQVRQIRKEDGSVKFTINDIPSSTFATVGCWLHGRLSSPQLKFWKKMPEGVEFVKQFHAHLKPVNDIATSPNGSMLASCSMDHSIKFYDVRGFDMSHILTVDYEPTKLVWVRSRLSSEPASHLAVADAESGTVRIYASDGTTCPVQEVKIHQSPVVCLTYNAPNRVVVSADKKGSIEYWSADDGAPPPTGVVSFRYKMDTDLYALAKAGVRPCNITISPDGTRMVVTAHDKQIRVYDFARAKIIRLYDESLRVTKEAQDNGKLGLDSLDFGRRAAVESELDQSDALSNQNAIFDESGHILIYPTLAGIKMINIETNKVVRVVGKVESGERFLRLHLFQGTPVVDKQYLLSKGSNKQSTKDELDKADKPDPTICATAFNKKRFYLFSTREPPDPDSAEGSRDVFNEKPTAEELATVHAPAQVMWDKVAVLHTTFGDIQFKIFGDQCPKTAENFCTHARNGYYDGTIFHRVIKGFMIQTGDPEGDGTGGESIWGGEFEDECVPSLRHDRPYTVSMANSGPNTNGSQFFITTVPCQWLDNKHTVFGRVTSGMDVVQSIENCATDKLDRPAHQVIKIMSVGLQ